ncbi:VPLPA-CTERM-specific exosortase XrtD [Rhodovulum visakhapatnamense]|uniref:Exosortase D (VPLPA-CTERM-specific) n=1 Tax=Rhodovulum visakhapatnamense TaxID=364297 RepID=A0A4R8F9P4_9RHOB|nr:VPLPA-CTERM-specific exosortase XrtD [Rhodovulum visakhapatnamense]TDX22239.1 exosortase D (VPLPA-CTERM-specific) [Rhodovulum visakhapatnamense]
MTSASDYTARIRSLRIANPGGLVCLLIAILAAGIYFRTGIEALLTAWQTPEYSHGPIIPVLSAWMWLKELKAVPERPGPKPDRWPGVVLVTTALALGALGILSNIGDIAAYGIILWIGGMILISFGWQDGRKFWPPVLHLVYMLPLPATLYYKVTTSLQFISSELGAWFLHMLSIPVYLDGNIIDLGVTKLLVAEACSGLRYMFPIMSFSYVFAVLYRGPKWHKAVLLISAVPIAIFMNSVRIALAGVIVQHFGLDWVEGFSHFFEGWVIFLACILILFGLAWLMLQFQPDHKSLSETLDLDFSRVGEQVMRLRLVRPSAALIAAMAIVLAALAALSSLPERGTHAPERDSFAMFPRTLGNWTQQGPQQRLERRIEQGLAADDYLQTTIAEPSEEASVGLFMAWYNDQSKNGVHSPEVCLPGSGWEIAWLERIDIAPEIGADRPFHMNRAIIQKGETKMMVYYWFQQRERRIALDYAAKFWLMADGVMTGRTDGALVRLTTLIGREETEADAERRLNSVLRPLQTTLPRFIPES